VAGCGRHFTASTCMPPLAMQERQLFQKDQGGKRP
jgi:hypothetical protein